MVREAAAASPEAHLGLRHLAHQAGEALQEAVEVAVAEVALEAVREAAAASPGAAAAAAAVLEALGVETSANTALCAYRAS